MNLEVNRAAKAYAKEEIVIEAPPEKVYRILSDINHWPDWQSNVSRANLEGSPEVDKPFTWRSGGLKIRSRLHTVNPVSEFGWTGRIWWISAVHNWTITDRGERCVVTVEESLRGFLAGGMRKSLQEGMQHKLRELKAEAEA
jgi:uncharacterized protein YndB with AHSA1/START domain